MKPFVSLNNREVEDLYHYLYRNPPGNRPRTERLRQRLMAAALDALDNANIIITDINPE